MSGSQLFNARAKGLYTHSNPLADSAVPAGSFANVSNVVVDRNEIIEPRRGFKQYENSFGDGTDRAKQLLTYKDSVLRHVLSELQFDLNGAFSTFNSLEDIQEIQSGLRIKGIEANGNLYFTTLTGIKKISARSSADFPTISIQDAGGAKSLDLLAAPDYSTPGFLSPYSRVAYRLVWGKKDLNENLILGEPSARTVVYNISTTDSCIVALESAIPADVTDTTYFYQLYRTAVFSGDLTTVPDPTPPVDPGDEMYLVFEDVVTSAQLTAGKIEIQDITPEDFRSNGTLLYTNPESGDGIEQANGKPPFATDIALYKNYTFYANTKTVQRFNLSFLTVQGMVTNVSNIVITDGTSTNTYLFQGSLETYTINFTGCVKNDFHNASPGTAKYFTFTSANDEIEYLLWYYNSVNDEIPIMPGKVFIKCDISSATNLTDVIDKTVEEISTETNDFNFSGSGTVVTMACSNNGFVTPAPTDTVGGPFVISKDGLGTGEDAANKKIFLPRVPALNENGPTPSQQLEQIARSLVNVIQSEDNIVYAYYVSGYNDVPGQVLLEQQETTGPQFFLRSNIGDKFNPTLPVSGNSVGSTNEVSPNRVYYSKLQQPEAVPIANYIDVGPKDREIKRIIALRDSLFIFKEDGIYRLSGETAPFTVAPFDFSAQMLAADTAVVLNNQIYCLTTQGVCVITDTGNSIISRPIENLLLQVTRQGYNYKTISFGVSYETDRSYILFLPSSQNDTVATQAFRYNTFTSAWSRWDVTATCGLVNFSDDKMYIGAGDLNSIEQERKSLTRTDHADRQYDLDILANGVEANVISLNSVSNVEVGDVLIQQQYLTISQFNRLLTKLDSDISVTDNNYYALLHAVAGDNLRAKLTGLATKLDSDPGVDYASFASDIGDYSYPIISITAPSNQTVLNIGTHDILVGRHVIVNTSSTPYEVISTTSTTITLDALVPGVPTVVQTAVNSFPDYQGCFNIIVDVLNNDDGVFYSNYPLSEGTVEFEIPVLSFDKVNNTVVVKFPMELIFGTITLYKAIESVVIWNPIYFGDPSVTKQIREGTMIFENSNFSKVNIAYGTDLSPSFETILFEGEGLGVGDWGYFSFGSINWGGVAAPIPLRTLIPRSKQRCRFINIRFTHRVAFEKYAIYGISLTWRPVSSRGYR